jgi:hypothetical protein
MALRSAPCQFQPPYLLQPMMTQFFLRTCVPTLF